MATFPITSLLPSCPFLEFQFHNLVLNRQQSERTWRITVRQMHWRIWDPCQRVREVKSPMLWRIRMMSGRAQTRRTESGKIWDCTYITKQCWKVNRCPSGQFRLKHSCDDRHSIQKSIDLRWLKWLAHKDWILMKSFSAPTELYIYIHIQYLYIHLQIFYIHRQM